MRIVSGGISPETNTFAAQPTTLEDFIRDSGGDPQFSPQHVIPRYAGTATIHGGYLAEMLRTVGIEPQQRRLLVVKSAVHFRADLGALAERIFDADTPGVHRPDFASYTYRRLRRPIYPLDPL
jgi:microcystin degradation protein MlrC